jgi:SAM-dependent methyltransferase
MTSDDAAPGDGADGAVGSLPFDTSKAHQARVYDYLLGGKDNYAADRAAVEAMLPFYSGLMFSARANRAFLGRAVRFLTAEAGVRQFLDIGTGIPTAGNVHEVAQAVAPESRVVYVDYDPIVLAHARALLDSHEAGATEYIDADLRDTGTILTQAAELLDFTKPVAITVLSLLHAIADADDPYAIVARLLDAVPPGSYLVISHTGADLLEQGAMQRIADSWNSNAQQQAVARTREQVARFFTGTDLLEPGLVRVEEWRPEPGTTEEAKSIMLGAVGQKR